MKKKYTSQYSGNRSRKIWSEINSIKNRRGRESCIVAFCLLQNMEGICLTWLNNEVNNV